MNHLPTNQQEALGPPKPPTGKQEFSKAVVDICIRYLLPFIALAAGILITIHLLKTGPQARPTPSRSSGIVVETTAVHYDSHPTVIHAMGVVTPAQTIDLRPQVSGQIISISDHLVPGGRFKEGDALLRVDPTDYRLALEQQENAVVQAQNDLELEEGNQLVVKKEYDLLGEQVSEEEKRLILRQPQLSTLQTKLSIAKAHQEQAELNLARTIINAPYNGIVQDLSVNIGTWVSTSSILATLVGSDSYWVEVSIPEEQLQWLEIPTGPDDHGSMVKIYNATAWGEAIFRQGELIRLLPNLEPQGRMARLLVEIDDPLSLKSANGGKPQVMIDSFVRVEIEGKGIARAVELPREYLHNGTQIWVHDDTGKLVIREVTIGFKNRDSVLVTEGITGGENIVITDISTPVAGLPLKSINDSPPGGTGRRERSDSVVAMGKQMRAEKQGAKNE